MKNFDDIYAEILKNSKNELEDLRKNNLKIILGFFIIVVIFIIIGIKLDSNLLINCSLIICIIESVVFATGPANKYAQLYKERVVTTFVKEYNKNLDFYYNKGIPSLEYMLSNFEHYDKYSSEDLITGYIDNYKIDLAEVHTEREYEDEDGGTYYNTVFHGLFGMCKLNKSYNGILTVCADKGFLGKLFQSKNRIEMDSSEFEKYFEVIADDKIQAMQILTSDIMDRMVEFVKNSKLNFELKIDKQQFYIRFKTGSMYEGNVIRSSVAFDNLKKVYDIINFTLDLIKMLTKNIDETEI